MATKAIQTPFTGDAEADRLLTDSALALLIGMLLDQQIPMEKAFRGPAVLRERTGRELDAADLAERADLKELFARPPAIHRFPGSMAERVQRLCAFLVEHYDGDASRVWQGARTGAELKQRLTELPGFGEYKAQIFLAVLGKRLEVRPRGWREAAGPFGVAGSRRSIADVTDAKALAAVRAAKREMKAAARQAKLPDEKVSGRP